MRDLLPSARQAAVKQGSHTSRPVCGKGTIVTVRQVFLSSTVQDLGPYRDAVAGAIERLDGYKCVRSEGFLARDWESDDFCRGRVAECDVYVGLLGHFYGRRPPGREQSYTEREYEAAIARGVPRLIFLASTSVTSPKEAVENAGDRERQRLFRERVSAERLRGTFDSPDDAALRVVTALANWEREQGKTQRPDVLALRILDDGGHRVELLNRGPIDAWDIEVVNDEPRAPPGVDNRRRGTLPYLRAGEREEVFLEDFHGHSYRLERPGYGLRITWTTPTQDARYSAEFVTQKMQRGARFDSA